MILLLDQGNSRLKWMLVNKAGVAQCNGVGGLEDFSVSLGVLGASGLADPIDEVHVSSVAGEEQRQVLGRLVIKRCRLEPVFASSGKRSCGIQNGYDDPTRLGVDRWLAMIGARRHGNGPALIVDAGTALTIDAIALDGEHLGGYIVPGYRSQCLSLGKHTAAVRTEGKIGEAAGWGRTTDEAVSGGIRLSLVALIEKARVELESSVADTCPVILTGGDSALLRGSLSGRVIVDGHLLFRGLWYSSCPGRPVLQTGEDVE